MKTRNDEELLGFIGAILSELNDEELVNIENAIETIEELFEEEELEMEEKEKVIELNLAGTSKKDIQVSVVPHRIVVGVENKVHTTYPFPEGVNPEDVKANYKNGLLVIKHPANPDPYKVEVK